MSTLALLIPLVPLLAAAVLAAVSLGVGSRSGSRSGSESRTRTGLGHQAVAAIAVVPTVVATILTIIVLVMHGRQGVSESMVRYAPTGGAEIWLGARVDGLAALIAVLVCVVATAVQVYSTTYMLREPRYTSYVALISLFTAAMLTVVYSADLVILLIGWEVMGACSYFLIGHYWEREEARAASIKAFLITKTGDIPFLIGILLLGRAAGTFRIGPVVDHAIVSGGGNYVGVAAVLLLGGVIGKSAQFPLQTWLPDAMTGPTPISALIHAATMVAAGVYVVARLYPVFLVSHAALWILGIVACVTMLGAAVAAFAQRDLKRILAYSTISQLAYMTAAVAVGGRSAAVFHLVTHGGFKALLFLAAGVVIHAAGTGDTDELRTRDLGKKLPITFVTTTIGLAALAGVPPLSGFFSKESILGAAYETATGGHAKSVLDSPPPALGWLVLVVGLLTAAVTVAYCARTWLLLFAVPRGERAGSKSAAAAVTEPETAATATAATSATTANGTTTETTASAGHDREPGRPEAPWTELGALVGLAAATVLLGFLGLNRGWFPSWLGDADGNVYRAKLAAAGHLLEPARSYALAPGLVTTLLAMGMLALGGLAVWFAWRAKPAEDPAWLLGRLQGPALNGFHADRAQQAVVVRPVEKAADLVTFLDREVVDGYVRGTGVAANSLGALLRRTQNGNVQLYLTGVLTGAVVIAAALGFGR